MTRPIKFRAWDEENSVMVYPKHADHYDQIYSGLDDEGVLTISYTDRNDDYHEMVVMQFTGLLDKTGKEIYESDILRWNGEIGEYKWVEEFACFEFQGDERRYPQKMDAKDLEVISNIYETPELLK